MSESRYAIEQMKSDLNTAKVYEERASALDNLGSILKCEYPGTVHEVTVKRGRWWHRNKESPNTAAKEIILSDDERREFAYWCIERSNKLRTQSLELNLKYAMPKE